MPNVVRVQFDGLAELEKRLQSLALDMQNKIAKSAAAAGANVIRKAAQDLAPVRSGALKKSIQTRRDKRSSGKGRETRMVGIFRVAGGSYANSRFNRALGRVGQKYQVDPPTFYWRFLEFGTVKQSARPFLRPAFDRNKGAAVDAMVARLKQRLDKAGA